MKFTTSLRSGSVRWSAPAVLLLTLLYYAVGEQAPLSSYYHYAPTIVAEPLTTLYALAYAVAAALSCWESGRLRGARVWALAPARSRYRIAANSLAPVIVLSWSVLLLPPAISLVRSETMPSLDSLRLPLAAMVLCVAHAIIGFAVGCWVPRTIATPILAVIDWVTVAFTRAVLPYWPRHVSGQFGSVGFGEVPDLITAAVPVLLAGGIATGLMILWLPYGGRVLRVVCAAVVAVSGVLGAYRTAVDWPHTPPLTAGHVVMACAGSAPRMCVPEFDARYLSKAQHDTAKALRALRVAGAISTEPRLITDSYVDGRRQKGSTDAVWRMMLISPVRNGNAAYQVMVRALHFRCEQVSARAAHSAWLWGAVKTGQEKAYRQRRKQEGRDPVTVELERQVRADVNRVLTEPRTEQAKWIRRTLDTCEAKKS
ncbi:hypothetical protein QQY24_32190 [Streptomyces sp. TG1A-8]|uniref:hypothetical protein n=1 Tax=Streptomyces sp. TG1A-8 TaxID=3051385 RepID=UPI00265C3E36|nr:hypothetical protein [Streptomyces sp. TG1A-8]MDO0929782.1 hypothetical protein [Streptomyces sp. TG1A-8]